MTRETPARWERVLRALSYVLLGSVGVWTMFQPFVSGLNMNVVLGEVLTWIWSILLAMGIPAGVAAWFSRYRIEYVLLPCFMSALILATAFAWFFVPMYPPLIVRVLVSSAVCVQLIIRYVGLYVLLRRQVNSPWTSSSS